jgi:hypothetical protein
LLLHENGEFIDVAKGVIVMPQHRKYHGADMPYGMHRVRVTRPLPGCGDLYPPTQPADEDKELKISELSNHVLLWPKALIRVDTAGSGSSQPKSTPPVAGADNPPKPMTQQGSKAAIIDDFIACLDRGQEEFNAALGMDEAPSQESDQRDLPSEKYPSLKKKLFDSQETPEEAAAFAPLGSSLLSPATLLKATMSELQKNGTPAYLKKKGKGRKRYKGASASQPVIHADKLPIVEDWRAYHVLGQPMMPPSVVRKLTGDLRSVHDTVLMKEEELLRMKNPGYPLHVGKVPKGMGFVDTYPGDLFFVHFDEIFNLVHLKRLDPFFIRLMSLKMQIDLDAEHAKNVAIMDPFYMYESIMSCPGDRVVAAKHIENFLLANKEKSTFLMPYFPE